MARPLCLGNQEPCTASPAVEMADRRGDRHLQPLAIGALLSRNLRFLFFLLDARFEC